MPYSAGYSAHSIIASQAIQAAEAALQGLSPEDRRFAFANACACAFIKRNQTQPGLAEALTISNDLHQALGFGDAALGPRLAQVAAALCDVNRLPASESLAAAILRGDVAARDLVAVLGGDGNVEQAARRLKHAIINLLVAVIGSPNNNHLTMFLLEPLAMFGSFPVGFVYGDMPGQVGYHFDCGCVLDAQGHARRNRPPLQNNHLHFVNFCGWAMLSVGLLIFPENCNNIGQVLTEGYIREVQLFQGRQASFPDLARTFAMNYALQTFECVCQHQGYSHDDRALAFSRLFQEKVRKNGVCAV